MRVQTKKANKDYPEHGIKKGETYYEWAFFRQRPTKSKTYPTRSQLTQNDTLQGVYDAYDSASLKTADDVSAMAEAVREAGQTASDKRDNMPEGLQEGETGQRLKGWAEACESAADELDRIAEDLRGEEDSVLPPKPERGVGESDDAYDERLDKLLDEAGISDEATYYTLDRDAWTWTLSEDALEAAVLGTEPELE